MLSIQDTQDVGVRNSEYICLKTLNRICHLGDLCVIWGKILKWAMGQDFNVFNLN
jgi:hypothetical protein